MSSDEMEWEVASSEIYEVLEQSCLTKHGMAQAGLYAMIDWLVVSEKFSHAEARAFLTDSLRRIAKAFGELENAPRKPRLVES